MTTSSKRIRKKPELFQPSHRDKRHPIIHASSKIKKSPARDHSNAEAALKGWQQRAKNLQNAGLSCKARHNSELTAKQQVLQQLLRALHD